MTHHPYTPPVELPEDHRTVEQVCIDLIGQEAWTLIGVSPNAEPMPAPVAPTEAFDPLAGLDHV